MVIGYRCSDLTIFVLFLCNNKKNNRMDKIDNYDYEPFRVIRNCFSFGKYGLTFASSPDDHCQVGQ